MELFYNESLFADEDFVTFGTEESHHIRRVMRKKVGEMIHVTNGKGLEWIGQLVKTETRIAIAKKTEVILHKDKIVPFHIAVAPTKSNDRLEWLLEKATEIGVSEITPLICDHSERKTIKTERMKKILIRALKQSVQFFLPQLNPMISFEAFMQLDHPEKKLIAHCQNGNKIPLNQIRDLNNDILILIGPEGDFSRREIKTAQNKSFTEISLVEQRLRTETAAIVACIKVATLREISKVESL